MTLSALIRKRESGNLATAIPAISATQPKGEAATVARIATVAVANRTERQATKPLSSWAWRVHFTNRDDLSVTYSPEATQAQVLSDYPDAVAAEPFTPTIRQPLAPLTASEETAIRAWLALIEETDPATIAEVIGQCQRDADVRDYFSERAAELPKPVRFADDRRTCDQCANLIARRCQAAKHGEIVASRNYEPIRDLPRRCEGYAPGESDPDRRHGRERWPELIQIGGE